MANVVLPALSCAVIQSSEQQTSSLFESESRSPMGSSVHPLCQSGRGLGCPPDEEAEAGDPVDCGLKVLVQAHQFGYNTVPLTVPRLSYHELRSHYEDSSLNQFISGNTFAKSHP